MDKLEIRWIQRLSNLEKAFLQLSGFIEESLHDNVFSNLEKHAVIKSFEYTFELSWKTLQDIFEFRGLIDIKGPKPVLKHAFQDGLIKDGELWLRMLESRNLTSHIYKDMIATKIVQEITTEYIFAIKDLIETMSKQK